MQPTFYEKGAVPLGFVVLGGKYAEFFLNDLVKWPGLLYPTEYAISATDNRPSVISWAARFSLVFLMKSVGDIPITERILRNKVARLMAMSSLSSSTEYSELSIFFLRTVKPCSEILHRPAIW